MNQGFSIIELMIAVAVISVLAAFAIPAYGNYLIKARISEAISLVSVYQTAISDYYNQKDVLPNSNADIGIASDVSASSNYVASIVVESNAVIRINLKNNVFNQANQYFYFYPTLNN